MEFLDIVDTNGNPTGKTVDRKTAHREGLLHRTSHVWIMRRKEGRLQVLLQKRCQDKDSFPGCYDISSAGHIPAGFDYRESAVRELKEELNVDINPDMLIDCGLIHIHFDEVFHGEEFRDRQVSRVFLLKLDKESDEFTVQKEEIDEVRWMDYEKCLDSVENNRIPNCIRIEELKMLEPHFDKI